MPGAPASSQQTRGRGCKGMMKPMEWHFMQCFGERVPGEQVQDVDIISAMEFDRSGENLATGDRGGRVVLFEKVPCQSRPSSPDSRGLSQPPAPFEYRYLTEFQSHVPEFDYLKSLEIEEKINKVRWWHSYGSLNCPRLLLSTNDKTIKLWKVSEKKVQHVFNFNSGIPSGERHPVEGWTSPYAQAADMSTTLLDSYNQLRLPKIARGERELMCCCRKTYGNAHAYHVNSVSINSDQATFLSADDLRIHVWDLDVTDTSFNIVDLKPPNLDDLTEVITSAEFHPQHCNIFAYASSKGLVRLVDMRKSALCDDHDQIFEVSNPPGGRSLFSEMIGSISDMKFSSDGRHILTRDYMTLRLWDLNMGTAPVLTFQVHEHLRSRLCELYENDAIFDKFSCCISSDGQRMATGTYNNLFRVLGKDEGLSLWLESSWNPHHGGALKGVQKRQGVLAGLDLDHLDIASKMLHLAWHPKADVLAVGACNSLFLFHAT